MDFKLFGGILLIIGTSIGAGMLALPIATAKLGFIGSFVLLFVCWFIMMMGGLCILEVNLWMRKNSNIITMAKETLGINVAIFTWFSYLILLYSLLAAYIGGGSGLLHHFVLGRYFQAPMWLAAILFTLLFSSIVTMGIRVVDYTNRSLMFLKFGALFLLFTVLSPFISKANLLDGQVNIFSSSTAIMVTITSFGFATIIPSLRIYFDSDIKKLKIAVIIGSFIPFICYALWDLIIMGTLPLEGAHGLKSLIHANDSTSALITVLSQTAANNWVISSVKLFTSVCVLTSFLAVSLSLSDFLADGMGIAKKGMGLFVVQIVTFLPPLLIVLFFPNVFIKGLEYAGINCLFLLLLLPAWMSFHGRYRQGRKQWLNLPWGRLCLLALMVLAVVLIIWGIVFM